MLSNLKTQLEDRYGEEWYDIEPETITLDLGIVLTPVMLSQLFILKTMAQRPDLFLTDANYFLRFVQAANNNLVDLSVPYIPNSLALAWGLYELKKIWPEAEMTPMIERVCHYILQNEGYGAPPAPFDFITLPFENTWATPEDLANKAKAIQLYRVIMEEGNG